MGTRAYIIRDIVSLQPVKGFATACNQTLFYRLYKKAIYPWRLVTAGGKSLYMTIISNYRAVTKFAFDQEAVGEVYWKQRRCTADPTNMGDFGSPDHFRKRSATGWGGSEIRRGCDSWSKKTVIRDIAEQFR